MRKLLLVSFLILPPALLAERGAVARCTAGAPRWEGKAAKFKVVLDNSIPPGECRVSVSRGGKEVFASQGKVVDILTSGVDSNMDGMPDLVFQTGPTGACCWTLYLLSLEKSPRLIGKLENSFPFALRGQEVPQDTVFWTQDGIFGSGFDGLTVEELGDLPSIALKWDGARAFDAAFAYANHYDLAALSLGSQLTAQRIGPFLQSDGKLEASGSETQGLRKTKAQIVAMLLAYLYAGNEGTAWSKLSELWPAADAPRIHRLLVAALETGFRSRLAQLPAFTNNNCRAQGAEDVPFRVGDPVKPPRVVSAPDPEYSPLARAEKYQGTVVLWVLVSSTGCVREVRVYRSLGLGLDEKAVEGGSLLEIRASPKKRSPRGGASEH